MLHQHECALELTTCAATRKKRWGFAGAALGWGVFFPEALSVRLSHTLVNPFLLNQTQQEAYTSLLASFTRDRQKKQELHSHSS